MPQNKSTRDLNALRRYTWTITQDEEPKKTFDLELLPEVYEVDEPARVTVTQTRGEGWVDHFGMGFGTLTLSGTTGWGRMPNRNKAQATADTRDGFERWLDMRNFFAHYHQLQGVPGGDGVMMSFANWTQEDYYEVVPVGLPKLQRSTREPLIYRYTILMNVVGRLDQKPYVGRLKKLIEQLAQDTERVERIGERVEQNLDSLWLAYIRDIQHQTAVTNVEDLAAGFGLGPAVRDAQTQAFIDTIVARNASPDYVPPSDSGLGVLGRSRLLSEKIADWANGKTSFVASTLAEVRATAREWRNVLDALSYAAHIPASYAREVRETLCSVHSLLLYPQVFRSSVLATYDTLQELIEDSGCATTIGG